MHGGAAGSGAPSGKRNGAYKRGHYTAEALAELREMRALLRAAKAALEDDE
jgi:glucans biosynthesis protein